MAFSLFPILSHFIAPAAAFISGVRSARPGEAGLIPGLSRLTNYYLRRSSLGRSRGYAQGRSNSLAPSLLSPQRSSFNGP